jgi:adenine/guanine phosphoribosyltransferase-like PRPP-binding protein
MPCSRFRHPRSQKRKSHCHRRSNHTTHVSPMQTPMERIHVSNIPRIHWLPNRTNSIQTQMPQMRQIHPTKNSRNKNIKPQSNNQIHATYPPINLRLLRSTKAMRVEKKSHQQLGENLSDFEIPSWNQIYRLLLNLTKKIRKSGFEPDIIVSVSRGGWLPARIMSDLLENPNLANVTTEFYNGVAETKREPVITQAVSVPVKERRVLIVDDVADTGESLKLVDSHLQKEGASEVKIETIYYKP